MANRIFKALSLAVMLSASAGISAQTRYTVLPSSPEQHIQHFGASDAWSMQFIGLWPEQQQRQVADWLFSSENDEQGKPKGIGLSIWRFNLGAGSVEQGDKAEINSATRTECFLRADGTYDWTKQEGQRRFLKLAKERGVPYMLAFCNSAPVYFTKNGLATNTGRGGTINLKDDCYDDFARFMATSVKGIEEHDGVHIDYISPCNEPDGHWNWLGPKQEGSPATNREVAHVARELGKALSKQKLNTEILVNESSDYRCMLGTHVADWQRGNEIKALFSKDSTQTYVGNVKHMMPLIGGHSYWTNTPIDYMRECRMQVREACKKQGIKFWQTDRRRRRLRLLYEDRTLRGTCHPPRPLLRQCRELELVACRRWRLSRRTAAHLQQRRMEDGLCCRLEAALDARQLQPLRASRRTAFRHPHRL